MNSYLGINHLLYTTDLHFISNTICLLWEASAYLNIIPISCKEINTRLLSKAASQKPMLKVFKTNMFLQVVAMLAAVRTVRTLKLRLFTTLVALMSCQVAFVFIAFTTSRTHVLLDTFCSKDVWKKNINNNKNIAKLDKKILLWYKLLSVIKILMKILQAQIFMLLNNFSLKN